MSQTLISIATENANPTLRALLEDVHLGHVRLPRFQRSFSWTDHQRIELLRSIRAGMPIAPLLLWRTSTQTLATHEQLGKHVIPQAANSLQALMTPFRYILDGYHRILTLHRLLFEPMFYSDEQATAFDDDGIDWDIQYNLETADFELSTLRKNSGPLLPLTVLLDGRRVRKYMRRMASEKQWNARDLELWEERADQISYMFQACSVPIVTIVTERFSLAVDTLLHINGVEPPRAEFDMMTALTWTSEFDLRQYWESVRSRLPWEWRSLDESVFLSVCKGLADLDMTDVGQTELAACIRNDTSLLSRAGEALKRAIEWLVQQAGVARHDLLPYSFQVAQLAVEFEKHSGQDMAKSRALRWFWMTTWSESFTGLGSRDASWSMRGLRSSHLGKTALEVGYRERDLPDYFHPRSPRVRLVILRLAMRQGLVDAHGHAIRARELLERYGVDALVRLFDTPVDASSQVKKLLQGAGNQFLLEPNQAHIFRQRLKTGPDWPPGSLEAHFIDADALTALRRGDFERFLRRRRDAMNAWDREQFESEYRPGMAAVMRSEVAE